jgi:hypothetical protein
MKKIGWLVGLLSLCAVEQVIASPVALDGLLKGVETCSFKQGYDPSEPSEFFKKNHLQPYKVEDGLSYFKGSALLKGLPLSEFALPASRPAFWARVELNPTEVIKRVPEAFLLGKEPEDTTSLIVKADPDNQGKSLIGCAGNEGGEEDVAVGDALTVVGFTIGKSTFDDVKKSLLERKANVTKAKLDLLTASIITDGTGYDIEGLKEAYYVFDKHQQLVGVQLNIDQSRFNSVFDILKGKYEITEKSLPFVGDKFVSFSSGDNVVTLDARHLSFDFTLSYMTNTYLKEVLEFVKKREDIKKGKEAAQL